MGLLINVRALSCSILKYATRDSTLAESVDLTQTPDKDLVEKEKASMKKLQVCVLLLCLSDKNGDL